MLDEQLQQQVVLYRQENEELRREVERLAEDLEAAKQPIDRK